jgi:hypothetical protein
MVFWRLVQRALQKSGLKVPTAIYPLNVSSRFTKYLNALKCTLYIQLTLLLDMSDNQCSKIMRLSVSQCTSRSYLLGWLYPTITYIGLYAARNTRMQEFLMTRGGCIHITLLLSTSVYMNNWLFWILNADPLLVKLPNGASPLTLGISYFVTTN